MSPREAFINNRGFVDGQYIDEKLLGYIYDAMQMASTHDPDQQKEIRDLQKRVDKLEHPKVSRRERGPRCR